MKKTKTKTFKNTFKKTKMITKNIKSKKPHTQIILI